MAQDHLVEDLLFCGGDPQISRTDDAEQQEQQRKGAACQRGPNAALTPPLALIEIVVADPQHGCRKAQKLCAQPPFLF